MGNGTRVRIFCSFYLGTPRAVIGFRSTRLFVLQRKGYCGGREEKNATASRGCAGIDFPLNKYFEHPVVVHGDSETFRLCLTDCGQQVQGVPKKFPLFGTQTSYSETKHLLDP